ncbi:MAG TPA: hypothetical protein PKW79_01895 [Rhabdochlamydiaceae bacterium]|nr:hypothetical protein [Rhabdochlamydiaceae bacterium]
MNFKAHLFFFFSINFFTTLQGQTPQDKIISDSLHYIEKIVTEAPEIIKAYAEAEDRYYLQENRIYLMQGKEYLLIADEKNIPLHHSLIFVDREGPYLSLSKELIASKLFKNVCYNCGHEWPGGFAFRCPRCHSKDIGTKPNW